MRIFLFLPFVLIIALISNVDANQFDEQTSSKIIQEAEKSIKKF